MALIKKLMNSHLRSRMDEVMDMENTTIRGAMAAMQKRMQRSKM